MWIYRGNECVAADAGLSSIRVDRKLCFSISSWEELSGNVEYESGNDIVNGNAIVHVAHDKVTSTDR